MMNPIDVKIEDGIATVSINRPERKNALSVAATNGLADAWEKIEADDSVRVAILTSADCGVFSAGMDLKEAAQIARDEGVDILSKMRDPFHETMRACKKPIIAAMTGSLMAGGMMLTLNCDLRVGLMGTKVGITEVKIGRGSPWAAPALSMLPQPILMEIVLTGDLMPIERLHDYGFTNYLEETPDAVRARAYELARRIASAAPLSVIAAKGGVRATMDLGCAGGLEEGRRLHEVVYASNDAVEGPKAFAEKRAPVWTGT
ncbi:enoyl-CoA hydratase [Salipiger aestuarii]|uniref:Enoyl-CoA hydratase/carnithine racemase n=3 Tax=Salipiger TaxID=263377 RepID=A0A1G7JDZ2_9RHOB|nr:enoyl-CoA hydratase-related protein [Salipiger aestuarii]EIE51218.1 putative enoyl-CoA hydratase/isomerase [Citreicella sp. 357]SDF23113.1 Enoyl-CoA hydratase/carnithine racemase [Salipiger thiooxidans]KAA8606799.1 enoyl-CoA hydratase [Salipiger aestuarii]KAA8610701.1 enoyl-CoA hydratase [Salipiger aestuarii]KAB2541495.1 enoyl-CoA hydratase [Salipiger aestuarii]